ncbi:MAG: GNAT family N-acetyltransferase [Actinobacteria bacterium]|nr:MAG: GNAT family N-acetyltransferase [Actinomycetota bacterium]
METIHGGVVPEPVVADLGLGHRSPHGSRGLGHGVRTQVDAEALHRNRVYGGHRSSPWELANDQQRRLGYTPWPCQGSSSNVCPPARRQRCGGSTRRSTRRGRRARGSLPGRRSAPPRGRVRGWGTSWLRVRHGDPPSRQATELFLNELAVLPAYRRRGAATTLLEELKHLAKEHGCVSIWVLTDEDNEAAVASYRKAGGEWDGATTVMFEIDLMR